MSKPTDTPDVGSVEENAVPPTTSEEGFVVVITSLFEAANHLRAVAARCPDPQTLLDTADALAKVAAHAAALAEAGGANPVSGQRDVDDSPLVQHARRELELLGEGPQEFVESIVAAVRGFCAFGHSGSSAAVAAAYVHDLLRWRALTPLTRDPAEWEDRTEISGTALWQNKRDSRAMSTDGGRTYWLTTDEADGSGNLPRYTAAEPAEAGR